MLQAVQQAQAVAAAAVAVRHPRRRALYYSPKVQEERSVRSFDPLSWQTRLLNDLQETISPDTILQHYVNVARRLTGTRQDLAANPCPSPGLTSTTESPKKVETIGEPSLVQAQAPSWLAPLDWPPLQWTLDESLTLDELPDSEKWSLPEYQLTQEWFEQTIRSLNDLEEEKRVEEEIEVDLGGDMDLDTEVDITMLSHVG